MNVCGEFTWNTFMKLSLLEAKTTNCALRPFEIHLIAVSNDRRREKSTEDGSIRFSCSVFAIGKRLMFNPKRHFHWTLSNQRLATAFTVCQYLLKFIDRLKFEKFHSVYHTYPRALYSSLSVYSIFITFLVCDFLPSFWSGVSSWIIQRPFIEKQR